MARRARFRAPEIYDYDVATAAFTKAKRELRDEIEVAGGALVADEVNRMGTVFYDHVVTAQGRERRKAGAPLPVLPGVVKALGVAPDLYRRAVQTDKATADDHPWIVQVAAYQCAAAWLIPDWLRNANYPELIDARRWTVPLRGVLADPIRRQPCVWESQIQAGMRPWRTRVLLPVLLTRGEEIARQIADARRQRTSTALIEVTTAWVWLTFYQHTVLAWHKTIDTALQGRVPLAAAVAPLAGIPKYHHPTPQQIQFAAKQQQAPVPAPAHGIRAQLVKTAAAATPTGKPAPTVVAAPGRTTAPTGSPTTPQRWQDVWKGPSGSETPEEWLTQLVGAGFTWDNTHLPRKSPDEQGKFLRLRFLEGNDGDAAERGRRLGDFFKIPSNWAVAAARLPGGKFGPKAAPAAAAAPAAPAAPAVIVPPAPVAPRAVTATPIPAPAGITTTAHRGTSRRRRARAEAQARGAVTIMPPPPGMQALPKLPVQQGVA